MNNFRPNIKCRSKTSYHSIIGGGGVAGFVFEVDTTKTSAGSSTSTQFKLPLISGGTFPFDVDWGDSNSDTITAYNQAEVTHTYAASGTYTITITGVIDQWKFNNGLDKLKLLSITSWGDFDFSTNRGFFGCDNMTAISVIDSPTVSATNLDYTFRGCGSLVDGDFSGWGTTGVTSFIQFLYLNTSFNGDISNLIHAGVTNIQQMMLNNSSYTRSDLSSWDVSGISTWTDAFRGMTTQNGTISGWVPSGSMSGVFNQNTNYLGGGVVTWTIGGITAAVNLFAANTFSTAVYDAILIAWEAQAPTNAVSINFGNSTYTGAGAGKAARASLISTYGWTIVDGGSV